MNNGIKSKAPHRQVMIACDVALQRRQLCMHWFYIESLCAIPNRCSFSFATPCTNLVHFHVTENMPITACVIVHTCTYNLDLPSSSYPSPAVSHDLWCMDSFPLSPLCHLSPNCFPCVSCSPPNLVLAQALVLPPYPAFYDEVCTFHLLPLRSAQAELCSLPCATQQRTKCC